MLVAVCGKLIQAYIQSKIACDAFTNQMGHPKFGVASTLLIEMIPGVNYQNIPNTLNSLKEHCSAKRLDNTTVQDLLSLQNQFMNECVLGIIILYRASEMIQTLTQCVYGFENTKAKAIEFEN